MKIIRNRKVATKLWIMISPAILALILFCLVSGYQQNKILKETQETFYDIVAKTSNLTLNADRDFYHVHWLRKKRFLRKEALVMKKMSS